MAKRAGKMSYGKHDVIKGELLPENEMVMISVKMEGDLLDALKSSAADAKWPYQTFMKQLLRAQLGMEGGALGKGLREIIEAVVDERLKSKRKAG